MNAPMPATRIAGQRPHDTTLVVTFDIEAPLGMIEVELDGADTLSHAQYVALLREAAHRLECYAYHYRGAMQAEGQLALSGA